MDAFKLPPNERMGTFSPLFPKGLVGIVCSSAKALADRSNGAMIAPAPVIPVTFKKFLRLNLDFFSDILDSPKYIVKRLFDTARDLFGLNIRALL
jgi:hypothetical protein